MNLPAEYRADFLAMPQALRDLLAAELAAGNSVREVGHSHPAPPAGAFFLLDRPVSTRARASGAGLSYYLRTGSSHSGEFTDDRRFFFVLEPPSPPATQPDMDAIREAMAAACAREDARRFHGGDSFDASLGGSEGAGPNSRDVGSIAARFRRSLEIDYEKWREGIGYDVDLIRSADEGARREIEALLLSRGVHDWRDVEALAVLGTSRARALLRSTLEAGNPELAEAVTRHAPDLVTPAERTVVLVSVIERGDFYHGLTQALGQVQAFHPPPVVDALLRGVLLRSGQHAVHFAAMLLYLHGQARSAFDWEQRPFLLRFNTEIVEEREARFRELCGRIGVRPEPYLEVHSRAGA